MSSTKYASELLDGFEILYKRTEVTLDSTEEIGKFLKKLSAVMLDYGKTLSKLAKETQKSSKSVDQEMPTVKNTWDVFLNQLDAIGEQHNKFASTTLSDISTGIAVYHKEKEKERKRLVGEGQRLTKEVSTVMQALKDAKKNYHKACEEADKAQATYLKAKNDPSIKPKDLTKLATKATQANDKANSADKEYHHNALKAANQRQDKFYQQEMPGLLTEFQKFEEDREVFIKSSFEKICSAHNEFPPFYTQVSAAMQKAADAINKDQDVEAFVKANRTNGKVPPAIEYEPYQRESPVTPPVANSGPAIVSKPPAPLAASTTAPLSTTTKPKTDNKPVGLSAADDSLSKDEKQAKLEGQLRDVRTQLKAEIKSRKGLEKLVKFYGTDPTAQEKAKGELEDQTRKVNQLRESKRTIEKQLSDLLGADYRREADDDDEEDGADSAPSAAPAANNNHSVSKPAAAPAKPSAAATAPHTAAAAAPPAPTAAPASASAGVKVRALYDYAATNENELSFSEGETLIITEQDDSGWWFAETNGKTGFIPSNYVQVI